MARYRVLVSSTFARQFRKMPAQDRERIRKGLRRLEEDPFTPRPGADIRKLEGTAPPKYRLRVGDYRAVYAVEGGEVRAVEVFRRERGYRGW